MRQIPNFRLQCVALIVSMLAPSANCADDLDPRTTRTLVHEMTDLAGLAEYPNPAFICRQFSSYDRASKSPSDEKAWFANGDAGQFIRVEDKGERKEYVMMDVDGPGAIVRIWSANPNDGGTLRIYLDGAKEPTIETPMIDFLGGRFNGLPPPISGEQSKGWNCYFPILYARHCKVTADAKGFYYHINYRTYSAGQVFSFKPAQLEELADDVFATAARLAFPLRREERAQSEPAPKTERFTLKPQQREVLDFFGQQAIVALRINVAAADHDRAMRSVVLRGRFDDEQTIECPLGDFFGAGPEPVPYTSLPLGVAADGQLWSHWVMPFEKDGHIEVQNVGDAPVTLIVSAAAKPYQWSPTSMHFHATWRQWRQIATRPMRDLTFLHAHGQGVYVGTAVAISNPVKLWWGEGDEKIYIDGESFPSHFGTGTEDYFGYAWCWPVPFNHAYHNEPRCDGPGNYGYTAVNRWHILDRIPFEKELRFDMELWHWSETAKVDYSVVAYWYGRPGATAQSASGSGASSSGAAADGGGVKLADLAWTSVPKYVAPRVAGAIEGESLNVLGKTGKVDPQDIDGASNDMQLWWREGKPGDKLVLALPAPAAGRYRVAIRTVKARDYGIHQLSVNGGKAGAPLDLYAPQITVGDEIDLGVFDLKSGENELAVEIVGANEKAVKGYMLGLDYVKLTKE